MKVIESRQIPIVNTRQVVWQPIADNGDLSMRLAPIDWQPSGAHACIQMLADDLRNAETKLTECEARLSKAVEALQWIAFRPCSWRSLARKTLADLEKQ